MTTAAQKKPREIEADWDVKATQSAIDAAKHVITGNEAGINGRAMISSLSDLEWGWIAAACVFAWIGTKAKQAVAEGIGYDAAIYRGMTHRAPAPWEAGAIETILPALGELKGVDWAKPIGEWPKEAIVSFAWQIHRLTDAALAARDEGAQDAIVKRLSEPAIERVISAKNGGPLMTRKEMDDDIPF